MCATLRHRGPDDEGVHSDPPAGVSIGARRLSMMDIDGGHQPLCNEDGSVWAAFNGEIYNHRALREDLQRRGHTLRDGWRHRGARASLRGVRRGDGACARGDVRVRDLGSARARRLLLARDRFGEKPLFLHEHDGELLFASELTSLLEVKPQLRELDPDAIDAFFVFAYVPGPGTIVPGVRQLPPGHLLSWSRERRRCEQRGWWAPPRRGTQPARVLRGGRGRGRARCSTTPSRRG